MLCGRFGDAAYAQGMTSALPGDGTEGAASLEPGLDLPEGQELLDVETHELDVEWDEPRHKLGQGGFGAVYRSAIGGCRGQTVAVKELVGSAGMAEVRHRRHHETAAVVCAGSCGACGRVAS